MTTTFIKDSDRYLVMCGEERIGFVRRDPRGRDPSGCWNAVDTFMEKSRNFSTRKLAGQWLERLHAKGDE